METFLTEFGTVRADRTGDTLYMRGLDGDAFLHVTHKGEPRFVAAGFEAVSMQNLEALAREEKASLDRLDGPGGGALLKLTDPNSFQIEVVAARTPRRARARQSLRGGKKSPLGAAKGSSHANTTCSISSDGSSRPSPKTKEVDRSDGTKLAH